MDNKQSKTLETLSDDMQATDMHSWVTEFEDNLNRAAGFENDYREFSRALFVAWPGEPKSPADYMEANAKSKKMGRAFSEVLIQLREFSPDMKINIIAHSQGNGVMLLALDHIGEHHCHVSINHVFAWQAGIPYTALNSIQGIGERKPQFLDPITKQKIEELRQKDPWALPYAHLASKNITALYSQNDNIVGPVIEQEQQPEGVDEKTVFMRKPIAEYLAGIFTTYLGLESLYKVANKLSFPATKLWQTNNLDNIWKTWINAHPNAQISFKKPNGEHAHYEYLVPDLDEQVKKLQHDRSLFSFFNSLSKKIKSNMTLLNEKLSWLEGMEYIESELVKYYLLYFKYSSLVLVSPFLQYPHTAKVDDAYFKALSKQKETGKLEITPFLFKASPLWISKVATFLYCTEIASNIPCKDGMGAKGIDLNNDVVRNIFRKKKLTNINWTPWVYEHSDMKVPSEDIMEEIHKKRIMYYMHVWTQPVLQE